MLISIPWRPPTQEAVWLGEERGDAESDTCGLTLDGSSCVTLGGQLRHSGPQSYFSLTENFSLTRKPVLSSSKCTFRLGGEEARAHFSWQTGIGTVPDRRERKIPACPTQEGVFGNES